MDQNFVDELPKLTKEYGGDWGLNHTKRLLKLIELIGEGLGYDHDAIWAAAHFHDWGGYTPWMIAGVDHAIRSGAVARDFLEKRDLPESFVRLVVTAVETHHQGGLNRPVEAQLLSDADALDFLGVIGVLRDFAKKPKALREAYDTVNKRMAALPGQLCIEKSKQIAAKRILQMKSLLDHFREESFGYF
jgi:HD superfamily phosphodiesterase